MQNTNIGSQDPPSVFTVNIDEIKSKGLCGGYLSFFQGTAFKLQESNGETVYVSKEKYLRKIQTLSGKEFDALKTRFARILQTHPHLSSSFCDLATFF